MADVELLPLPRWMETYRIPGDDFHTGPDQYLSDRMHAYARANLSPLQVENERLRAEVKRVTCELMDATTRAELLAEALRELVEVFSESGMYDEEVFDKARAALAQEQEADRG